MSNKNIYSVKQVNSYIRNMFSSDFMLTCVSIRGEVSNCKYHNSGHIYFTLKDEGGAISCIMFASKRGNLKFRMSDGSQVVVTGAVDVYEKEGKYQLYANSIESDGMGSLYERYEALKRELSERGMFDVSYKQPIPAYIDTLGVVTAPTGAAIRDIIQIARRRNPYVQIILYPAKVQGEGAAESIVDGIRALEDMGVDVIIVGRGGGSIEDLWAFNEEIVAQAIFDCLVPIISAVGHETDTTIADFVADLRAPTPSAGAELAVYRYQAFTDSINDYRAMMLSALERKIDNYRYVLELKRDSIKRLSPINRINQKKTRLVACEDRISFLMDRQLRGKRHRLELIAERLKGLSPLEKISGGYGFINKKDGPRVKSVEQVSPGDSISLYIKDGTIDAQVTGVKKWQEKR